MITGAKRRNSDDDELRYYILIGGQSLFDD
jgi:hypothetical protein